MALTATAQDDDHGDTAEHATALTLGVAVEGRIDPAGDVDYFSLELDAGETVIDDEGADSEIHLVVDLRETESCHYAFREHDPIGWEMVGGSLQEDRFRYDPMSSQGVWGKS